MYESLCREQACTISVPSDHFCCSQTHKHTHRHTQINKHTHIHTRHLASQLWATDVAVPALCQAAGAGCMAWLVLLTNSFPRSLILSSSPPPCLFSTADPPLLPHLPFLLPIPHPRKPHPPVPPSLSPVLISCLPP